MAKYFSLSFKQRMVELMTGAHTISATRLAKEVGVSQDSPRDSQRFAKQFGLTFPVLIDREPYPVSRKYGVEFVPTLVLITPDGQVEASGDGFSKSDLVTIQGALARHFGVTPPALFQPGEKVPEYKPG